MRTGCLRRRVTVATLAIVAASVLGLDVAIAVSLQHRLDAGLRQRLHDRAALAAELGPGRAERRGEELSGDGIEARVIGNAPAPATPAAAAPAPTPGTPAAPGPATDPARRVAAIHSHGAQLRIVEDIGGGMTVVLTASRRPVLRTMRGLMLIEAFGTLILLAAAGLGVRVVVRAALRPLDAVVATATRIAAGASGERLRPDRADTELGRLAGAFDTMVDALERSADRAVRAEEAIRRFLEDAGHELRTPAANISASAEALLRGDCRRHEREELEVALVRESQRMGRLVTDIVDLARGRAPQAATATVDVAAVVRREAAQLRHRHPDLAVDVDAAPTAPIPGDGMSLGRLVGNLLGNAANASPAGGRVAVTVQRRGEQVQVVVTDAGPGIPAAERERIFERFVRLEPSRSRDSGGTGLGLPIARSIARAHGGDVVATDARVGARFVAWLPAAAPVNEPEGGNGDGSGPGQGPEPDHDSQLSTCSVQSLNSQE
jgi:two-component system, OmpR family, sensor kinase